MQIPITITPQMLREALIQYLISLDIAAPEHAVTVVKTHRDRAGHLQCVEILLDTDPK